MLAIDTNVVVRVLRADDPEQTARAIRLVTTQDVLLLSTVVLEAEWVLRSGYRLEKSRIIAALRGFAALEHVQVEDRARLNRALDLAAAGMDLADAYHLAGAAGCEAFVTFDRKLVAQAEAAGAAARAL